MAKKQSVTLLFPGQGSQYVGMGKNLENSFLEEVDHALGFSLSLIMCDGPEEELTLTANAQPAILAHSIALYSRLKPLLDESGTFIERVLGHSVGEYAALVVAGALDFKDALRAVHWRGKFMQEATPAGSGTMIAVLNVPNESILHACEKSSTHENKAMPANYNTPSQVVISGHTQACHQAIQWLKEHYDRPFRSIELKVSAPFHSSLMNPAAEKLKEKFHQLTFRTTQYPYIANVNATQYPAGTAASLIENNLVKQVAAPVLWFQSMQRIPPGSLCLECGPGKTLMGMANKIEQTLDVIALDREDAWKKCKEMLL